MILKNRFFTQSAPDIRHKLLKQAYGPNQSLDTLLQLAQSIMVGNMKKRKAKKKPHTHTKKQVEALPRPWEPFLNSLKKMPRGTQVKRDGLATTVERRGTSSGIALRHPSCPPAPCLVCNRPDERLNGRETAPRGVGFRGLTLKTIKTEGAWGSPHKLPY